MVAIKLSGGKDLAAAVKRAMPAADRKASVSVGFQDGATEDDGTLVSEVAAHNEFGTKHSPPRPFFRTAIETRSDAWGKNLATAMKKTNFNTPVALAMVGLGMKEDVQDSIRELWDPPLAESTIARKGFDKPLIDTSTMLNSVTAKVDTGE